MGLDIVQLGTDLMGDDPIKDIKKLITTRQPLVFDVGANLGQSVEWFRRHVPKSDIHSFEPSPSCFNLLQENTARYAGVHVWNFAFGSVPGEMSFAENSSGDMSSFLELGTDGWGEIVRHTNVKVRTIDNFCAEQAISCIDILKIDTQGFDLEVLKGAERMIRDHGIRTVYLEIIFNDMYVNAPTISQIYDFMIAHGFVLVTFYPCRYQNRAACDVNALFAHKTVLICE